jgi:hypothetical protein
VDAVEQQLTAYNARDIDAFVACYHELVVIEDAAGRLIMSGASELRQSYGPLFRDRTELHAEILWRERLGTYVVDSEVVTGMGPEPVRAVAIYHLGDDGLIDRVRLVRSSHL